MKVIKKTIFEDFYQELEERNIEFKEIFKQRDIRKEAFENGIFGLKDLQVIKYNRVSDKKEILVAVLPSGIVDEGCYEVYMLEVSEEDIAELTELKVLNTVRDYEIEEEDKYLEKLRKDGISI